MKTSIRPVSMPATVICGQRFGNWVMSFIAPRMDRIKPSPSSMATMRARGLQGAVYGTSPYLRLSYSSSTEKLREACNRIQRACAVLA